MQYLYSKKKILSTHEKAPARHANTTTNARSEKKNFHSCLEKIRTKMDKMFI